MILSFPLNLILHFSINFLSFSTKSISLKKLDKTNSVTLPIPAARSRAFPGFNCFVKIKPFNNSQEHFTSGRCDFSKPPITDNNSGSFEAQ